MNDSTTNKMHEQVLHKMSKKYGGLEDSASNNDYTQLKYKTMKRKDN